MKSLIAGANVSLTKENPLLDDLVVGFGWNIIQSGGPDTELVPAAIVLDENEQAISDEHFIFFNQLSTPDDDIRYVSGQDKEQIEITLSKIPENVHKIIFIIFANPDVRNSNNFKSVKSSYVHILDRSDAELVKFNYEGDTLNINALLYGEIYRYKGEWKFRAIGQGYDNGIIGIAKDYKVNL